MRCERARTCTQCVYCRTKAEAETKRPSMLITLPRALPNLAAFDCCDVVRVWFIRIYLARGIIYSQLCSGVYTSAGD